MHVYVFIGQMTKEYIYSVDPVQSSRSVKLKGIKSPVISEKLEVIRASQETSCYSSCTLTGGTLENWITGTASDRKVNNLCSCWKVNQQERAITCMWLVNTVPNWMMLLCWVFWHCCVRNLARFNFLRDDFWMMALLLQGFFYSLVLVWIWPYKLGERRLKNIFTWQQVSTVKIQLLCVMAPASLKLDT